MSHAFNIILNWETSHSGFVIDSGEFCSQIHNGVWGSCYRGGKSTKTSSLLQPTSGEVADGSAFPLCFAPPPKCNHTDDDRTKRKKFLHSCFRDCGVSIHGHTQKPKEYSPGQLVLDAQVRERDQRIHTDPSQIPPRSATLCDSVPWSDS